MRTDQWLGAPLPGSDTQNAKAELVRRYLSCYGPSTCPHFSEWAGISRAQAANARDRVEEELAEADFEGRKMWLLRRDLTRLASPPEPEGIRFLPPHDPYLQMRDRLTLVPDGKLHRLIWRAAGNPGIVLSKGRPVAMWRPQKTGKTLGLAIELFEALAGDERKEIEAEAKTLAAFKGCMKADIIYKKPAASG